MEVNKSYQGKTTLIIRTIGNTTQEEVEIDGLNALEILKRNHDIETIQTGLNKFLKCVDNVCVKNDYWWKFYVNGELVLKSLDKYYPKEGDKLLIEYGET